MCRPSGRRNDFSGLPECGRRRSVPASPLGIFVRVGGEAFHVPVSYFLRSGDSVWIMAEYLQSLAERSLKFGSWQAERQRHRTYVW
jgi:hypothetical protein